MPANLLIIGASARAAAQSAVLAGYCVAGADLFGDADCAACGATSRVDDYPRGFVAATSRWRNLPWMYTGALENHPAIVEQMSLERTLWGNDAQTVRRVRDVGQLQRALQDAGIGFPEFRFNTEDVPRDGTWLRKAVRSAGGLHVELWDHGGESRPLPGRSYFQRRVVGASVAGVYVGSGGSARLLGVSTQRLVNANRGDFRYAGSSTVVPQHDEVAEQFERVGDVIAAEFRLTGLFGIDAVFDGQTLWPVEVNPRYTASVEIHERAIGFHAVALHAAACIERTLPSDGYASPDAHVAKTIHYAENDIEISNRFADWAASQNAGLHWPSVADVPRVGTRFTAGQPVTTLLVAGETAEAIERRESEILDALRLVLVR